MDSAHDLINLPGGTFIVLSLARIFVQTLVQIYITGRSPANHLSFRRYGQHDTEPDTPWLKYAPLDIQVMICISASCLIPCSH